MIKYSKRYKWNSNSKLKLGYNLTKEWDAKYIFSFTKSKMRYSNSKYNMESQNYDFSSQNYDIK